MPVLHELGHLAVEESKQQSPYVRPVDVRVGHDDDAVVAQLGDVVLVFADPGAQGLDQRHDLLRGNQLVEPRLLDVQYLALQREDRLELAVPPLLAEPPAESPSTM